MSDSSDTRSQSPQAPNRAVEARVTEHDEVAELTVEQMLAGYIDWQARSDFTEQARDALFSETKEYIREVCYLTRISQRRDSSEKALRVYVVDAASFLRKKSRDRRKTRADWCKWIGFLFAGFSVQQFINVQGQKSVAHGSITWLAIDIAITFILLAVGFVIDNPLRDMMRWLHEK